jgi:chromosome segregation ATPase
LTDLKIEKQKLRSFISQLNDPVLLAELNTFQQKLKEINEQIISLGSEGKNIDAQVTNIFLPEREKTQKIIKQLDKDDAEFNIELNTLNDSVLQTEAVLKEKEILAREFYSKFKNLFVKQNKINEEIQKNDHEAERLREDCRQVEIKVNFNSVKNAEIAGNLAALNQDFQQYEGVKLVLDKDEHYFRNEIAKFEKMMEEIGSVNMRALDVYDEAERQYNELLEKKHKVGTEKEDVLSMMNEIELKKKELFMRTFEVVNNNFKNFFAMLTTKGAAAALVI